MAKRSAKSKGYRKQAVQKPYLSKRDIAILCAAIVAVAIGAFFLFRYDDGALKVQDGVVAGGENWLIVNGSNARGGARYYKLGEIGEIDGYNRTPQAIDTDPNIPEYLFSPAEEGGGIASITVTTSHNPAQALAKYAQTALESIDGTQMGPLETEASDDGDIAWYVYSVEREQGDVTNAAPAEPAEDETGLAKGAGGADEAGQPLEANRFAKNLVGYRDAPRDSCYVIHVNSFSDAEETLLPDEALREALDAALAAITTEKDGK